MKNCCRCKQDLPLVEFTRKSAAPDGMCPFCKACARKRYEVHLEANRKSSRDRAKTRRATAKGKEVDRAYRRANRVRINAYHCEYYAQHREKYRELQNKWRRSNLNKDRAKSARKRARDAGCVGNFTAAEWVRLREGCDNRCLCCRRQEPSVKLEADHVLPLTLGGSNNIDNIQPLCGNCNKSKRQKSTDYREAVA